MRYKNVFDVARNYQNMYRQYIKDFAQLNDL